MSTIPPVSVALPVARAAATLEAAFTAIARQDHEDLDILLVLNGSDAPTRDLAHSLARADTRARILELDRPNLAAALNLALREARHDLLARMDADDTCVPHRLRLQAEAMRRSPHLAALATAWEMADPQGNVIAVHRPPTNPFELRWRLLLSNVLAHGSVMLRRDLILRAGAYDESISRAQDYDLWLRLIARDFTVASLPDVLYRHHTRRPTDPTAITPDQAHVAIERMLTAWRSLPDSDPDTLRDALAPVVTRVPAPDTTALTNHLAASPTRDALMAYLWAHWLTPPAPRAAYDTARRALLRERFAQIRAAGATRLWLWGAGEHTRWLLENDLPLPIAGLVDDHLAGQRRHEYDVHHPDTLQPGDHALISSDWLEDAIWTSTTLHRRRGVHVWRLYKP